MSKGLNYYNAVHIIGIDNYSSIRDEFPTEMSKDELAIFGEKVAKACVDKMKKDGVLDSEIAKELGLSIQMVKKLAS